MITIGCDPEFFIQSKEDGDVVPICGLLGGTKDNPMRTDHGFVQEDNCAVEVNTVPARTEREFIDAVQAVMDDALSLLKPYNFIESAVHEFQPFQILNAGDEALRFGCDPDYNAWTGRKNPRPKPPNIGFRAAAGHLHVRWGNENIDPREYTKACDLTLGVPGVLMGDDLKRKELYGQAGAFRPKNGGVEYRVLSNFWAFKPELIGWAFRGLHQALDLMGKVDNISKEIQRVINTGDVSGAERLCREYNLEVVQC